MKKIIQVLSMTAFLLLESAHAGEVLVIGNSNVPKMDTATLQKVYTGKFTSVAGINVTPVSNKAGAATRNRFLQDFLGQDEEKYTAYWTVRRYIGKGAPPPELATAAEIISYVQSTPGAIGYIDESDLKPGMNVISRK